jgi:hypothetical protein
MFFKAKVPARARKAPTAPKKPRLPKVAKGDTRKEIEVQTKALAEAKSATMPAVKKKGVQNR